MNRPSSRSEEVAATLPKAPDAAAAASALDLDVLMGRLREEVQARKREAAPEPAPPAAGSAKRVRAEALLELPEAAFVMAAYRLLLGRDAEPEEADRQIDRLLLGQAPRTKLLTELLATDQARAAGVVLEGLAQARRREGMMSSPVGRLFLSAAFVLRAVYLLPKRIRQFVKRVEALEQRASEGARQMEILEREVLSLRATLHGDASSSPAEPPPAPPPTPRSGAPSARRRSDAL